MNDSTTSFAAGWYPDTNVPGTERYYDGAGWTAQTRPLATQPVVAAAKPEVVTTANSNSGYAAGWYPDANVPGTERYYDGAAWTPHTRPLATPPAPIAAAPTGKSPWFKRKGIIIPAAVVVGLIVVSGVINAANGGADPVTADEKPVTQTEEKDLPAINEPAEDTRPEVPSVVGKSVADARAALEAEGFVLAVSNGAPDHAIVDTQDVAAGEKRDPSATITVSASVPMTLGQENAVEKAQSYLRNMGFSRAGLFGQLTSEYGEGFLPEEAEFAIAHLEANGLVDWNAEAVEKAQSYLDSMSFSRDGLYDQLTSEYGEQFTPEQANHALAAVGY